MVEEELDETNHWLDIIIRTGLQPANKMTALWQESQELLNIISKSIVTTKARMNAESQEKNRK